jgi:hypothetical protein
MEIGHRSPELYPDVEAAGSLAEAVQAALAALGSDLQVTGWPHASSQPFAYARAEVGGRFCQIKLAKNERVFLSDFWDQGVCLAHAQSQSLGEIAGAISYWIAGGPHAPLAGALPCLQFNAQAQVHEAGAAAEVEARWTEIRDYVRRRMPKLSPLVEELADIPAVRALYPYTSLHWICLSRCTGYPFSGDCPNAACTGDSLYEVQLDRTPLGTGSAAEAARLVAAHLPPGCGPAVQGTAEDLTYLTEVRVDRC